jgi:hypothetical protein
MNEQLQEKIMQYIDQIAKSLGVASEYVFETLVRQKYVEGWVLSIVLIIGVLALSLLTFKFARYTINNWNDLCEKDIEFIFLLTLSIFGILNLVFVLATILSLPDKILQIFNPEYYALKEILEVFQ